MKNMRFFALVLVLSTAFLIPLYAQEKLDDIYRIPLKQLEETWNILDQVTPVLWPDWKDYASVPFLFKYANGVNMLVGHPNPPEGFVEIPGVLVRDKKVYFDRSKEIKLKIYPPVGGGGGPIPYGSDKNKKSVYIVDLSINGASEEKPIESGKNSNYMSENQIMVNIHELFHCYQKNVYKSKYGNLSYNTDANYSTYAEIEGIALEKAYFEKDSLKAKEYLKDFIIARDMKYNSMDEIEINEGASDEMREGGAVYAETMTLEAIKKNYKPEISKADDPYFNSFARIDSLFFTKLKALRTSREFTMGSYDKSYTIGSFQALMLNRFAPGWTKNFYQNGIYYDKLLRDYLKISDAEKVKIAERIKSNYDFESIYNRHAKLLQVRDDEYKSIMERKGISFIVSFKGTFGFPKADPASKYSMGLTHLYPEGVKRIKMSDVEFTGENSPMIMDQLYYVKWIDTSSKSLKEGYKLEYSRKEGDDTYYDAVIKTGGFELKAPKVKLTERPERLKITILSKVKV